MILEFTQKDIETCWKNSTHVSELLKTIDGVEKRENKKKTVSHVFIVAFLIGVGLLGLSIAFPNFATFIIIGGILVFLSLSILQETHRPSSEKTLFQQNLDSLKFDLTSMKDSSFEIARHFLSSAIVVDTCIFDDCKKDLLEYYRFYTFASTLLDADVLLNNTILDYKKDGDTLLINFADKAGYVFERRISYKTKININTKEPTLSFKNDTFFLEEPYYRTK